MPRKESSMQLTQSLRVGIASTLVVLSGALPGALAVHSQRDTDLSGVYTVQQESSKRLVDAYQREGPDWAVVTRPPQNNPTQEWSLKKVSGTDYWIQQRSSRRFLDAYLTDANDFAAVTREAQNDATQIWTVTATGNGKYRIQQKRTSRHLDAYQTKEKGFRVVTREHQDGGS